MASIITLNAISDVNTLQTGQGLTPNNTVLATTLRNWVISQNFGSLFASNSIPSNSLQTVQGDKIQTRSLSGSNFTGGQIARLSIQEQDLADNAVTTRNIVNSSVTNLKIDSVDASKITTGTLADARIPDLNASKINAGTFNVARIPSLNASIINAGTFDVARIPSLNASIINDGIVSIARGGTGGGTQEAARTGLGLGSLATLNSVGYNNLQNIVTANRVLGSSLANSTVSEVQINPSMLTTGAPSWDSTGNLTAMGRVTAAEYLGKVRVLDINNSAYNPVGQDSGSLIVFNFSGIGEQVCILNSGLPIGFTITVFQRGTSRLRFSPNGVTLLHPSNFVYLFNRYSTASATVIANNVILLAGDLSAQ